MSELPDLSSCCSSVVKSFWLESSTGPIAHLGLTALGLEFRVWCDLVHDVCKTSFLPIPFNVSIVNWRLI